MSTEVIIVPTLFATIAFIVWTLSNGWQRRQQARLITEFNTRLLDRLGSVKDFNDLLQTDGGAQLLGALSLESGSTGARDRILNATQMGVVFVALGLGFLFLGNNFSIEIHEAFTILGGIGLSLGIGLLVSAGVSYFVARGLGILSSESRASAGPQAG